MPSIAQEWKAGIPAPGWREILRPAFQQPAIASLIQFLDAEREQYRIYPSPRDIFRAFTLTDFAAVRVVILGQDPYHGPGQAMGLAFSVPVGTDVPPSLKNIYKEIANCGAAPIRTDGDLTHWAEQGVFLLNTALTVREHAANSHRGKGWEVITNATMTALGRRQDPMVFMLWGRNAAEFAPLIDAERHLVLKAPHPSPLSAHSGFFGCGHFAKANDFLVAIGRDPIRW
jgi:uracil-DNA glycosylase